LRVFYTLPVQRRPNNRSDLRANQIEFDDEDFRFQFWGIFYEDALPWSSEGRLELYLFGLHDDRLLERDL